MTKEVSMETVTISPKFQVVIPKTIREQFKLVPGQKAHVIGYEGRIEILPIRPAKELRGMLRGMDVSGVREEEDRL
jgi:AbrB family looped-hinge helix DNA binding protein